MTATFQDVLILGDAGDGVEHIECTVVVDGVGYIVRLYRRDGKATAYFARRDYGSGTVTLGDVMRAASEHFSVNAANMTNKGESK